MKSAWGPDLCDMAAWNTGQVEDVDMDFEELLADDVDSAVWDEIYVAGDGLVQVGENFGA